MRGCALRIILLALLGTACCSGLAAQSVPQEQGDRQDSTKAQNARRLLAYGRLPLSFEANQGQSDERVKFLSRGQGYTLFLGPSEALFALRRAQTDKAGAQVEGIGIRLVGANPQSRILGADELKGKVNYFIGNDPSKWITGVPTYAKARYQQIYPGIDLLFYGNEQQLESDFVIAPGADPGQIRLLFEGGKALRVSREGDLVLTSSAGEVCMLKPHVYQEIGGVRHDVGGLYVLRGKRAVSFSLGAYNHAMPLVIDPILVYSTALNGANFAVGNGGGHGIAVDATGHAYVTGTTDRSNFLPTPGAFTTAAGFLFVSRLNLTGSAVDYTAVFGGSGSDVPMAIAVDTQGEPIVTGFTSSADFPIQNALQSTLPAGTHAFLTKLNAAGSSLLYSTLLGGSGATGVGNATDVGNAVTTDSNGAIYVTGYTNSADFLTKNAVQPACPDLQLNGYCNLQGFVTKLDPTQSGAVSLVYSTFLGGNFPTFGQDVAVDGVGNAYITGNTNATDFPVTSGAFQTKLVGGTDAFVSVLNPTGNAFVYSTYLGYGFGWGIAVDALGNGYVTGATNAFGGSFPVTAGAFQTSLAGSTTSDHAFVTKLNSSGTALVYSTFLGGSGFEDNNTGNITVDAQGNAYISGLTSSADFPTTNALQAAFGGGTSDAFLAKLNPSGSGLIYSTYLGGTGDDASYGIAIDSSGSAYVMGTTTSANFPTTPGAFEPTVNTGTGSLFVAKIGATPTTTTVSSSVNPSAFGQQISFTATVSPAVSSAMTPTGTVTFSDGATTLGTATISSGTAILNTSSLVVGSHSITAAYAGDSNFTISTSVALTQTVSQAGTAAALTISPNPANAGQTVTLTASVTAIAPGAGTPTGVVTFLDGATTLGTSTLNDAATAIFGTSSLSAGSHNLTASYAGDTNFTTSTSTPMVLTVQSSTPPPIVQITDNESVTVSDTESFPDVFDPEAVHVTDAVFVTPLITVTAPVAEFSAGGLGFSGQSGTQTITVSDIGGAPLTLASATISGGGQFNISQIACSNGAASLSTVLPSGGACILTISYAASATPANDNSTLVFTDNAALSNLPTAPSGPSYMQSVPLTGGGTNFAPPPPPPAIVSVFDNEMVYVADTESFPDVLDGEAIHIQDRVTVATLQTIRVIPATSTIANGATESFVAIGAFSDGSTQDLTTLVNWSSSNLTVATMNGHTATAVGLGQTTITAALGSIAGSTTLTVRIPFLRISAAFSSITRATNGGYNVTISVTNTGDIAASSVTPVLSILGAALTRASTPATNLPPGATATVTVLFPSSAGKSGSTQPLFVLGFANGTDPNGTPAPPALWLLPPRQVTLP